MPCVTVIFAEEVLYSLAFVCLLAGLRENYSADFHKIQWKGSTWATEEMLDFDGIQNPITLRSGLGVERG